MKLEIYGQNFKVNYRSIRYSRKRIWKAGALVQWSLEDTHILKVVGSNPSTEYWMDILNIYFFAIIVMFIFKYYNKSKRGWDGSFFKKTIWNRPHTCFNLRCSQIIQFHVNEILFDSIGE